MNHITTQENKPFHLYTLLLMLYFCIAPLEDLLTSENGTLAKYIALIIVFIGIVEKGLAFSISFNRANLCLIWLMILSVLSCVWAIDVDIALGRIPAYLMVPGICLFVGMLDFSKKECNAIVNSAILGGMIAVVYVFSTNGAELLLSGRITLNENNDPNNLAALLLLPLGLSVGKLLNTTVKSARTWAVFCIAAISFLFFLTGSRGGLLGVLAFFVTYLILNKAYKKFSVMFGAIVILAVIWFVILPMLPEDIYNRLFNDNFVGEGSTGSGRTIIWEILFTKIVPENFIMGVGAGCSPVALRQYFGYLKGVHNTYFNMLAEYGVLGLPAFIIMLYDKWKYQYKSKHYVEAALLVGMCIIIFFLDSYAKKFFWNVIMLLVINEAASKAELSNSSKESLIVK
jgi:O-antigen ligase